MLCCSLIKMIHIQSKRDVIFRGQLSCGQLSRGRLSGGNPPGGNFLGSDYPEGIVLEVLGQFPPPPTNCLPENYLPDNCPLDSCPPNNCHLDNCPLYNWKKHISIQELCGPSKMCKSLHGPNFDGS